ncbi:MAG TPA: hypothetical protein VGJ15_11970 [Pirellulales bacterium]|jgi:metal-responsive CopG/Arc/MetJ family transcriptional regulator
MATVKTAIAIEKPLFDAADRLARKLKLSRSRLYSMALEEYLAAQSNRRLLDQLNAAHNSGIAAEDRPLRAAALRNHRRLVEGDW